MTMGISKPNILTNRAATKTTMRWFVLLIVMASASVYAGRPRVPQPRTPDEVHQNDQDLIDKIEDLARRTALGPQDLTISFGEINIDRHYHRVDTQNQDPTDNLSSINGGKVGDMIVLQTLDSSRDVTVKDLSGNLDLAGDFVMNDTADKIMLIRVSVTSWHEVSRSAN